MKPVDLIVDALAVARITRLITVDTMPVLADARQKAYQAVGSRWGSRWADGIGCQWCVSPYVAALVVAVHRVPGWRPLATALAFSEITGLLGEAGGGA